MSARSAVATAYINLTTIPPVASLHPDYRDAFPFSTRAQLEVWLLLNTKEHKDGKF